MIDARFVPLERWPTTPTRSRRYARFRVNQIKRLDAIEYELKHLGARDVTIQAFFSWAELRNDGWPRSAVLPSSPGIILSFRNRKGEELSFPCDTYLDWTDNLYAIALSLEALRAVDRYGVTRMEEQYAGWKRLPAPAVEQAHTREWAIMHLAALANVQVPALRDAAAVELAYRVAAKKTHPDSGGNVAAFQVLQDAMTILRS